MNFYFELVDDAVQLRARLEDGDMLGDAYSEVEEGESFYGLSYDELRAAESGVVEVGEDGKGKIVDAEEDGGNF
jgi:hypothetical protein